MLIRLLIQGYAQFGYFRKGAGTSFSFTFCVYFFEKNTLFLHLFLQATSVKPHPSKLLRCLGYKGAYWLFNSLTK